MDHLTDYEIEELRKWVEYANNDPQEFIETYGYKAYNGLIQKGKYYDNEFN
jgi:hypothetical protein